MPITPTAASLPITKAARVLGVHPNTLRAWADRGRIRCLRVNARGDRRFLVEDLQAFMRTAEAFRAKGFDEIICISVNEQVVHGIGGRHQIQPGDIVKIDVARVPR